MKRPEKRGANPQAAPSLVMVGVITAAHGLRGQVKLRSFTQNPDNIFTYAPLTDKYGRREFKLTREGFKDQLFIVNIDGVGDRNDAEALKGTELYTNITTVSPPESDNEWLYSDLEGLQARLEDGSAYGTVNGVYNFGAGDIIDVEKPDGGSEMIPFSKEFVGEVNVKKGYLIITPPDYLEGEEEE